MRGLPFVLALAGAVVLTGCGGSSNKSAPAGTSTSLSTGAVSTQAPATTPSALQAEATAAAAGDIPDNQVFIGFNDSAAGFSMKYPEGWAQQGAGSQVTFRNNNNIVRVVVRSGSAVTAAAINSELAGLHGATVTSPPQQLTISGAKAFKAVYRTQSAANPVTGKRVTLTTDRYYLAHGGKVAIVDLGSPLGVDNVDAYRLMIQSFRWK